MEFKHTSVLLNETVTALNVKTGGLYIDCTAGGGGHSLAVARKGGRLICFDVDKDALTAAKERLAQYDVTYINANFSGLEEELQKRGITETPDGILMDLGVSSYQLDAAERGFSFRQDAPLDMRLGDTKLSAYDVVNGYSEEKLIEILYRYGEEKYAKRIVHGIAAVRNINPIKTTSELAEIIKRNVPLSVRNAKNPCRKTFQAVRIEVNDELGSLSKGLDAAFTVLKKGGRLAVITFHSLEDTIVKKRFADWTGGCDCPKELPLCVCGKTPQAAYVIKKPATPAPDELTANNRSRSAKLRAIEKL